MNKTYIAGFTIIVLAIGFTMWAFSGSMTPYVDIKQARQLNGDVQVRGKIVRDAEHQPFYDTKANVLRFWLEDINKEKIEVVYHGAKPEAFDTAPETAAKGSIVNGVFSSNQLVVKCPSKYDSEKSPYTQPKGAFNKTNGSV